MATRRYRRDNRGRFAGSGGGSMITYGKAPTYNGTGARAKSQATSRQTAKRKSASARQRRTKRIMVGVGVAGAAGAVGVGLAAHKQRKTSGVYNGPLSRSSLATGAYRTVDVAKNTIRNVNPRSVRPSNPNGTRSQISVTAIARDASGRVLTAPIHMSRENAKRLGMPWGGA